MTVKNALYGFYSRVKVYKNEQALMKEGNEQVNFLKPNRHRAKQKSIKLGLDVIFILNSCIHRRSRPL